MRDSTAESPDQIPAVMAALKDVCGEALLALYLHGSAVSGGLRPQSDIDLLAIVAQGLAEDRRARLLAALLRISARHPARPGGPRCIELLVVRAPDLAHGFPARAEFLYGEWLRGDFEAGESPLPSRDPEYTLLLAQAQRQARPLFGPPAAEMLPEIPLSHIRRAMRDALPALLAGLPGDGRNVLLTLARMWHTASTGVFVAKDAAAAWAMPQIPDPQDVAVLDHARRAYLGEAAEECRLRGNEARRLAQHLRDRILALL
ncbi:protein of unknown function [Paracoccus pantotrophus]|nr:protein of unknown function [Paracoccus pantotrophus]